MFDGCGFTCLVIIFLGLSKPYVSTTFGSFSIIFLGVLLDGVFIVVVLHEYGMCCFVPVFVVPYKPS